MIIVTMDITIPRAVWQELDTYKVGTVRNSCSTMHKLGSKDLEEGDFEDGMVLPETLASLNDLGINYRNSKSYNYVRSMKLILPEGFLQKATYLMNYETAVTMFMQRRNHRLRQWRFGEEGSICTRIHELPYMQLFLKAASRDKNDK